VARSTGRISGRRWPEWKQTSLSHSKLMGIYPASTTAQAVALWFDAAQSCFKHRDGAVICRDAAESFRFSLSLLLGRDCRSPSEAVPNVVSHSGNPFYNGCGGDADLSESGREKKRVLHHAFNRLVDPEAAEISPDRVGLDRSIRRSDRYHRRLWLAHLLFLLMAAGLDRCGIHTLAIFAVDSMYMDALFVLGLLSHSREND